MNNTFKVLVCGGRDYSDKLHVWAVLHEIHAEIHITHLIEGDASGVDRFAGLWAQTTNGVQNVKCRANWDRDGKSAGPIRNVRMADLEPDLVVAFPGGVGTTHMVKIAKAQNITVREVK